MSDAGTPEGENMAIDRTVPSQAPFAWRTSQVTMVSESDSTVTYEVTLPSCTCKSFRYRGGTCKHIQAAMDAALGAWVDPGLGEAAAS
jgi:uncharacterized Zn finger protein